MGDREHQSVDERGGTSEDGNPHKRKGYSSKLYTLFVDNLPLDMSNSWLRTLFSNQGEWSTRLSEINVGRLSTIILVL